MTAKTERRITLDDGRILGFAEYGDPAGRPIFYCHGFPASRLEAALVDATAEQAGVRLIAADRPGYGLSDSSSDRALLDWPGDVAALADALQLERFAVLGVSGGAPYALACAHRLGPRLTAAGIVGGLPPLAGRGMRWPGRYAFALGRGAPRLAHGLCTGLLGPLLTRFPEAALSLLTVAAPAADRAILARPEVRVALLTSLGEAFRQGGEGAAADLLLLAGPWGFEPGEVAFPVHLWHGETDATVPCAMGRALAADLPDCRSRFVPGEGHFSLPIRHGGSILRTLAS